MHSFVRSTRRCIRANASCSEPDVHRAALESARRFLVFALGSESQARSMLQKAPIAQALRDAVQAAVRARSNVCVHTLRSAVKRAAFSRARPASNSMDRYFLYTSSAFIAMSVMDLKMTSSLQRQPMFRKLSASIAAPLLRCSLQRERAEMQMLPKLLQSMLHRVSMPLTDHVLDVSHSALFGALGVHFASRKEQVFDWHSVEQESWKALLMLLRSTFTPASMVIRSQLLFDTYPGARNWSVGDVLQPWQPNATTEVTPHKTITTSTTTLAADIEATVRSVHQCMSFYPLVLHCKASDAVHRLLQLLAAILCDSFAILPSQRWHVQIRCSDLESLLCTLRARMVIVNALQAMRVRMAS